MDLYLVLGLERAATVADIKRAYRRLARKYHPDINPGDGAAVVRFRQITQAYETLSDPERRRRYDSSGTVDEASPPRAYGFEGFDFSVRVEHERATTFGDLFAEVFERRGPEQGAREESPRGADLHTTLTVSFEESIRGTERQVTMTRREACAMCAGQGTLSAAESRCVRCHGSGVIRSARGHMVFTKPCQVCQGTGRLRHLTCPSCAGAGQETRAEVINVRVPAGIPNGARVRVPGKGNAGPRGGAPGDLYLTIDVMPHAFLRREGDDLHMVLPVAVHEAALGAKIEVPTIDGPARLRVPPGTQSGQRFRLRDRGAPSLRGGRRGDFVVEVRLALPRTLDERSKELLREFGKVNQEDVRQGLTNRQVD
jgi:molecular chaperone DnaJ